jgi:hypothetical protein
MRKRKMNDTMGEFKRGDVIVKIDGNVSYVVTGSFQTALFYELIFPNRNRDVWFKTELDVDYVDSEYVKIDHVGERKINEFYRRLS